MSIDTIIMKRFVKRIKSMDLPIEIMCANSIGFMSFTGIEIFSGFPHEIVTWRIISNSGLVVMDYMPTSFKKVNVHVPLMPHERIIIDFGIASEIPDFNFDCALGMGIRR